MIESGAGLIVGECELVHCHGPINAKNKGLIQFYQVDNLQLLEKWKYAWVISKAKRYNEPTRYNHPHGAVIWVDLTKEGVLC